jgi:hypothetical protein
MALLYPRLRLDVNGDASDVLTLMGNSRIMAAFSGDAMIYAQH